MAQGPARRAPGEVIILKNGDSVYDHVVDALRGTQRDVVCGQVRDVIRVENHQVSPVPVCDPPTSLQPNDVAGRDVIRRTASGIGRTPDSLAYRVRTREIVPLPLGRGTTTVSSLRIILLGPANFHASSTT